MNAPYTVPECLRTSTSCTSNLSGHRIEQSRRGPDFVNGLYISRMGAQTLWPSFPQSTQDSWSAQR